MASKVLFDECSGAPPNLEIPIVVSDEDNELPRDPRLTSFLVPFSRTASAKTLNGLGVFDAKGKRLAAQLRVLSRFDAHPGDCAAAIRFAFAEVADTPEPGATVEWVVKKAKKPAEVSALSVQDDSNAIVVNTGVARFTIGRLPFSGLTRVEVAKAAGGFETISELGPKSVPASFYVDHGGLKAISKAEIWRLEVESAGPQVAVVVVRGYYQGNAKKPRRKGKNRSRGLGFTIRFHFVSNSSVVRVDHTYYHGATAGWGASELTNRTEVARAWMTVPLVGTAKQLIVRADDEVRALRTSKTTQLEQLKRGVNDVAVRYEILADAEVIESGEFADHPFMAAVGDRGYVMATIARMSTRDPQGFTWSEQLRALDIDFTSSKLAVGGARGIWSTATIDFGVGAPTAERADVVQQAAERPLLGTPRLDYLNGTDTIGPYPTNDASLFGQYRAWNEALHSNTMANLRDQRVTGLQIWPDLPADSCLMQDDCAARSQRFFPGGSNNYWNWSKPAIDGFFRTGKNHLVYEFSLPEVLLHAETLSVRPDHHHLPDSSVAGLSPCYGGIGFDGKVVEGLNHRRDNCPGDYTYNKSFRHAYLVSGDRRFADYFEEAGFGVVNILGTPRDKTEPYLEFSVFRLSEQRYELLSLGAEFSFDPDSSRELRGALRRYIDYMLKANMVNGHACTTASTGQSNAFKLGYCSSNQLWMMPTVVAWALNASRYLKHDGLAAWVVLAGARIAEHSTVLDGDGLPDYSRRNSGDSWRTGYQCDTNATGVVESTCKRWTQGENEMRYYNNGMMATLSLFGLVLSADAKDPNRICQWLPSAIRSHYRNVGPNDLNGLIWGKSSGQALAYLAEAVGAVERNCK